MCTFNVPYRFYNVRLEFSNMFKVPRYPDTRLRCMYGDTEPILWLQGVKVGVLNISNGVRRLLASDRRHVFYTPINLLFTTGREIPPVHVDPIAGSLKSFFVTGTYRVGRALSWFRVFALKNHQKQTGSPVRSIVANDN